MQLLAPFGPTAVWLPPIRSAEEGFRARAKFAVFGTANTPVFSFPGPQATADLADCPLHPPDARHVMEAVRAVIVRAQISPYQVARRKGELKNVIVTMGTDGSCMLQFVLRTDSAVPRIREHLPGVLARAPEVVSVWANLHPQHTTQLTGEVDLHLAGRERLAMPTGDAVLFAGPRSFVQTNTAVAGELYRQVAAWASELAPATVWDLYCGLGGFSVHIARTCPGAWVTGVEVSADAITGANLAAEHMARENAADADPSPSSPLGQLRFITADATAWAREQSVREHAPDLVVVNPPRRGIGTDLASWLEHSRVEQLIYSSCNPATLAADLTRMPGFEIRRARWVDMFPHTEHAEVLVHCTRRNRRR